MIAPDPADQIGTADAARWLGVDQRSLSKAARLGLVDAEKVGNRWLLELSSVQTSTVSSPMLQTP